MRILGKWGGLRALLLALLVLSVASQSRAQDIVGEPWTGSAPVVETIDQIMEREKLLPQGPFPPRLTGKPKRIPRDPSLRQQLDDAPLVPRTPFDGNWNLEPGRGYPSLTEQHPGIFQPRNPQTLSTNFLAMTQSESGFIPPDTQGDVSPTQVLITHNGRVKVFNKSGTLGPLNTSLDNFFSSVRNGVGTADPRCVWDRITNRWFVVAMNVSTPNRLMIAVSSGATITGTASFAFYFFQQDLVGTTPNADTGTFADYPSLGVDANALYIGANMFNPSFYNTTAWVVRKSSVTGGGPIVVTAFRSLLVSGTTGPFAPRGVTNDDPAATEGYFIGADAGVFSRLQVRRVTSPGATPVLSGNIAINVAATTDPILVPAQGSTIGIEPTNDRLFDARIFRNRSTGVRTLWTAQSIQVNASGVASTSGGRNGARWYQIQNLTATPTVAQSGTLFSNAATNPTSFIYPTVAMSGQGHMAIGTSSGGPAEFMSVSVAGRLVGDTAGATQARTIAQAGVSSYTVTFGSGRNRWGDYSSTIVDPADDQTIWAIQQYCDATDSYAVRAVRLLAPPPASPNSCSPASVAQGASNINVVLTGSSVSGSAFYDTEAGLNRIQAFFSGTGITVNSVTRNSDIQLTINISVSPSAATLARNITITNPDGQTATGTALLTVTGGCVGPAVTTQPSPQAACVGGAATFTLAASGTTPAFQWRRNGTNIAGATASTLTLNPVSLSDAGSYDCVITNGCGTATSNPAVLTVNSAPAITLPPAAQSACQGASASFSVAASGSPTPSFQWRRNGTNIAGATSPTLTINPVSGASGGLYDCVITNLCGSVTTSAVALTVTTAPSILTSPSPQAVCTGQPATFSVAASGTSPLTFQWRRNSVNIAGATASTLNISAAAPGDAGTYDCVVTNICGSATSGVATLSLNTPPSISTQPANQEICPGSAATFQIVASGSPAPTYQWRRNAANIPGATSNTFNIASAAPADAGTYDCVVTNACGSATSAAATLVVNDSPVITTPPVGGAVNPTVTVTFTVTATGTPPLSYQWRKDGTPLSGAAASSYVIASASFPDSGSYDVVVTNPCGSATSPPAVLDVVPCVADTDDGGGTGIPDGGVGIEDLLFYLALYDSGDLRADVDDGSGGGVPDGGLGIEDLLFYLGRYDSGC